MKKLMFATVAMAALATPALAADLPARGPVYAKAPAMIAAVYNWSGFYIGAQAGYAWSRASASVVDPALGLIDDGSVNGTGWKAGGHLGFNMQSGALVYGVEGDLEWADVKGNNGPGGVELALRWQGSARARLGFAMNNTLLYGTAGWAWAGARSTDAGVPESLEKTIDGWTLGAGLEHGFTPNMTARIEYRYADFGNPTFVHTQATERYSAKEHALRVGLTYKFGGPLVARY